MNAPVKQRRLLAIEREIRLLRKAMPDAMQLKVDNGILIAANRRLLGEIAVRDRNAEILKAHLSRLVEEIERLRKTERKAA